MGSFSDLRLDVLLSNKSVLYLGPVPLRDMYVVKMILNRQPVKLSYHSYERLQVMSIAAS